MVAGISYDKAFGMCHVGCNAILYSHVVCYFDHVICYFKSTVNFNVVYLKV